VIDYCYLCGAQVHQDKWRLHMLIKHKAVLSENPKVNGKWKREYKLCPFGDRRWRRSVKYAGPKQQRHVGNNGVLPPHRIQRTE